MKRIAIIAVVLILAILLGCSPKAPVTSPPTQATSPSASSQETQTPASSPTTSDATQPSTSTTSSLLTISPPTTRPDPPTKPPPPVRPSSPTPTTPTQTKPLPQLDAFMKGIQFNDWPFQLDQPRPAMYGSLYYPPQADESLKDLATTGANWISVMVDIWQETISSTNITRMQYATASDEALRHVISLAHSLGIRVTLLPDLLLSDDPAHDHIQIGTAFTTETQWQEWFASYREHINHFASFAQEAGVDMLYIGCEMASTTQREGDWRQVVKEVRERFKGPISYDSVFLGFSECKRIKWWDAVDYIATDYWGSLTDKNDPTVAELKEGWIKTSYVSDLEIISKQFNKPIIISEIGYDSLDGTSKNFPVAHRENQVDLQEQADCYQAAFETFWGKPWLKGIFWFQWNAISTEWPTSPQGKPAEEVLRQFYLSQ
jgi:hypothetical protein